MHCEKKQKKNRVPWPRGASEDTESLEIICNILTLYILFRK